MKKLFAAAAAFLALTGMQAPAPGGAAAVTQLWRLDCGDFMMKRYGAWFSDTFQYPAGAKPLVGSCYLIRNGNEYLLWDTGLSTDLIAKPEENADQRVSLKRSILDQLKQIGVTPAQIGTIAISHFHFDHTGQASHFPDARLLIGNPDWEALKGTDERLKEAREHLSHWLSGPGKADPVRGDRDIFKDGRVIMLTLPGHTPGHSGLLVRLASGPVLLSGDQYHFTEQVANRGVPAFNTNRADTLASHDRFDRIAANLKAKVVIQHEPDDVAKLPPFPRPAQ